MIEFRILFFICLWNLFKKWLCPEPKPKRLLNFFRSKKINEKKEPKY